MIFRFHIGMGAAALALVLACLVPSAQGEDMTFGELTSLRSTSEGMLSNRFQRHCWFTSDGKFHVVSRATETSPSLQLLSARDASCITFDRKFDFQGSDAKATSDGVLLNDRLFLVCETSAGGVGFFDMEYLPDTGTWEQHRSSVIYEDPASKRTALRPSIAVEAGGRMWAGCTVQSGGRDNCKTQFGVFFSDDWGATWTTANAGLPPSAATDERSLRVLGGQGVAYCLYSDRQAFGLSVRPVGGDGATGWSHHGIFVSRRPEGREMTDLHGAHFSAALDADGNLHFASNDGIFQGLYMRYSREQNIWKAPQLFNPAGIKKLGAYMQISTNQLGQHLMVFSGKKSQASGLAVFRSADNGATWLESGFLTMGSGDNTGNARPAMPEFLPPTQVILQQVASANDKRQGGVRYFVPGASDTP